MFPTGSTLLAMAFINLSMVFQDFAKHNTRICSKIRFKAINNVYFDILLQDDEAHQLIQ